MSTPNELRYEEQLPLITPIHNNWLANAIPLRSQFRSVTTSVTILLGADEQKRLVPRELLTTVSPFFHAALTGTFAEGLTQTVRLPEDRADVFDYFLYWLYTRRLDHEAVDAIDPVKPAYFWLLHLYCLVDKFQIESCKNAIIDKVAKLAEETNSVPTPTDTWIVFEPFGSQDGNKLRKLVVDLFAWKRTDNLLVSPLQSSHVSTVSLTY